MSGIENITREILQEAEESAASELQEARAKAEEVVEKAREEANELSKKAHVKADADAKAFVERTEAEAESYSKRAVLLAKSEIIKSVLSKAKEKFLSAAPADYFAKLLSLIEKSAMKGDGEIILSQSDKARIPSDFVTKADAAAKKAGGSLRLSSETADISGGFILRYGGIDINSSVDAIMSDRETEFEDAIRQTLWPEN